MRLSIKLKQYLQKIKKRFQTYGLPKGTVKTAALHATLWETAQTLDKNLRDNPHAYREMMLTSFFMNNQLLNYANENNSCFYLCRFGASYAFEYYIIYRFALKILLQREITRADIYSFGSGSMIDTLSLSYALEASENEFDVSYTGIDAEIWKINFESTLEHKFIQIPMQHFFDEREYFDGNVLFFPKILSELREGSGIIEKFCEGIKKTEFTKDVIMLMVSYRSKSKFLKDITETDGDKMLKIVRAIEAKGFSFQDTELPEIPGINALIAKEHNKNYPYFYIKSDLGNLHLKEIAPDFCPDSRLCEYLSEPGYIRRRCEYYSERENEFYQNHSYSQASPKTICDECCNIKCNTAPRIIYKQGVEMCFQILLFERKKVT